MTDLREQNLTLEQIAVVEFPRLIHPNEVKDIWRYLVTVCPDLEITYQTENQARFQGAAIRGSDAPQEYLNFITKATGIFIERSKYVHTSFHLGRPENPEDIDEANSFSKLIFETYGNDAEEMIELRENEVEFMQRMKERIQTYFQTPKAEH
ncbi:MAG: hypothetical protein AABW91_00110 [Nanoarchaeota archaeon]